MVDPDFGGLRLHSKDSINQHQVRAMSKEYKLKIAKENCKTHPSNTHIVDCESDNSDDEGKEVYVAELV